MKKLLFVLFIALSTSAFAQEVEYYFTFNVENKEVLKDITRIISIDNVKGLQVWAYASPAEMVKFKELGYRYTLLTRPSLLNTRAVTMATTLDQMAGWDRYPTYEVYRAMMKRFEATYPTLCKLDSIGTSIGGRKLYVAKISANVSQELGKPAIFLTSTMHGDEATGYGLMLRLIDSLLTTYGQASAVTNLLDKAIVLINPNANPDGTYYSGNQTVAGAIRGNKNGIDLNRNFPDPWFGKNPDGKTTQTETQIMMDFAKSTPIVLSANFHGGAEVVNYPWDYYLTSEKIHPDKEWFFSASTEYANLAQANGNAYYFTDIEPTGVTNGAEWYRITGGRQDYMNYFHHCREITIEISYPKLVGSDQLPYYWRANRKALFAYMNRVITGIHGTVKDSDGNNLKAIVTAVGHDKDSTQTWSNNTNGKYFRLIAPGTYTFSYAAAGYNTEQRTITLSSFTDRVEENVVLTKSTTGIDPLDSGKGNLFIKGVGNEVQVVYNAAAPGNITLSICDALGRTLFTSAHLSVASGENVWTLSSLLNQKAVSNSIYFITITQDTTRATAKVVVLK